MLPYYHYDQIILGPLTIYTWGLFLGLSFVIGLLVALAEAKRKNINRDLILNLGFIIFLSGLIGARLGYIIQFPGYYFTNPLEIIKLNQGGFALYGGFIGAVVFSLIYLKIYRLLYFSLKKERIEIGQIFDIFAPAIAIGIFIGRIGCALINDHQGIATSLPWGIQWPDGIIRHPIAIYLSLNSLLIFVILWYLRKRIKKEGQLFFIFLSCYSLSIFLLSFLRADPLYFGLSGNQWISLGVLLIIILLKRQSIKKFKIK